MGRKLRNHLGLVNHDLLWHVKDCGARIRKYMKIVKHYGGLANGCQLSLLGVACRPENVKNNGISAIVS